jgi:hypothetical protein
MKSLDPRGCFEENGFAAFMPFSSRNDDMASKKEELRPSPFLSGGDL